MIAAMTVRARIGILPLFPLPALPRLLGDALKRDLMIRGCLREQTNVDYRIRVATSLKSRLPQAFSDPVVSRVPFASLNRLSSPSHNTS